MRRSVYKLGSWKEMQSTIEIAEMGRQQSHYSLRKLSLEQRRKRFTPYVGADVPLEKQKMIREEFKKEDLEINK